MEAAKMVLRKLGFLSFNAYYFSQIGFLVFSCMDSDGMGNMEGGIIPHET